MTHATPNIRRDRERGYSTDAPIVTHDSMGGGHDEIADDPQAVADLRLTLAVSEYINSRFGGNPWMIKVSHHQQVVMISLPIVMGQHWKYTIPFRSLSRKTVFNACGEILERYGMRRGAFSETEFLDAVQKVPRWLRGTKGVIPT